jgi:protein TonB
VRDSTRAASSARRTRVAPRAVSFAVHAVAVAWIYQAHLAPLPPLEIAREVELVAPLFVPPPPPLPPPEREAPPPEPIERARVRPRAPATPPPESAQTEALPAPPAPPAPPDAAIGETIAREAYVRSAKPLHRPDPKYPRRAARVGREGFVTLRFTILETGAVTDIEILDADPRGYFEEAAQEAVSRWRYAPCEWNGVKVSVPGVMTRLRFELRS